MARNTATLSGNNVFKPAENTIQASAILAEQLQAYEGLLRALGSPVLLEGLRENDLTQIKNILGVMVNQLTDWLKLPNS